MLSSCILILSLCSILHSLVPFYCIYCETNMDINRKAHFILSVFRAKAHKAGAAF